MARPKKRKIGHSLPPGHLFGGRGTEVPVTNIERKRYSNELCKTAMKNGSLNCVTKIPGIRLRPADEKDMVFEIDNSNCNEIVDLQKQQLSYKEAHKEHKLYAISKKSTKHVPALIMKKICNRGFGLTVQYSCNACSFLSAHFDLFDTTPSGACLTNVQSAVAFSKTCVKPSDAEFLFRSLNVSCPSRKTLQKHFTKSNAVCESVLESSLSENRATVRDYVTMTSKEPIDRDCPAVSVSFDGQYNQPVFHGFNGTSTSLSEPVLEEETNLHLMVAHAVVSKKDGSYPVEKVGFSLLCLRTSNGRNETLR